MHTQHDLLLEMRDAVAQQERIASALKQEAFDRRVQHGGNDEHDRIATELDDQVRAFGLFADRFARLRQQLDAITMPVGADVAEAWPGRPVAGVSSVARVA